MEIRAPPFEANRGGRSARHPYGTQRGCLVLLRPRPDTVRSSLSRKTRRRNPAHPPPAPPGGITPASLQVQGTLLPRLRGKVKS